MTIRHLQIFTAVADCGSMSAAAEKLYISQPTVSQAVAEIEKLYHVKLFERLSQRLYITEEGEKLLSYARHILDSFENMERELLEAGSSGHIRIGCSVSVGTCLLNELLDRGKEMLGDCSIHVTVDNTSIIESMILSNQIDIGIVEGIVVNKDLMIEPVCRDELVLVCGKDYPLASRKKLRLADLEGENFISREQGSADRNQLEKMLAEQKIWLNRCWNCTNTEAIKNAVIRGRGIAVLSRRMVEKELATGDIVVLSLDGVRATRNINLVIHKNKYISKGIKLFQELVWN